MQPFGKDWHLRLMGSLFGLGCCALGLVGVSSNGEGVDFAMIAIVTGLIALVGSLSTSDIRGLWYCNPERSKHAKLTAKEAARRLASLEALDEHGEV